jgi:hypothetical protein
VLRRRQRRAQGECLFDPLSKKKRIDLLRGIEGPDAGADLRFRAVGGAGQHFSRRIAHFHGFSRVGVRLFNRTGKDPGMAPLERFLAPLLQHKKIHFFLARGCAAS